MIRSFFFYSTGHRFIATPPLTIDQAVAIVVDGAGLLRSKNNLLRQIPQRFQSARFLGPCPRKNRGGNMMSSDLGIVQMVLHGSPSSSSSSSSSSTTASLTSTNMRLVNWYDFLWHLLRVHENINKKRSKKSSVTTSFQKQYLRDYQVVNWLRNKGLLKYVFQIMKKLKHEKEASSNKMAVGNLIISRVDIVRSVSVTPLLRDLASYVTKRKVVGFIKTITPPTHAISNRSWNSVAKIHQKNVATALHHIRRHKPTVFQLISRPRLVNHIVNRNAAAIMSMLHTFVQLAQDRKRNITFATPNLSSHQKNKYLSGPTGPQLITKQQHMPKEEAKGGFKEKLESQQELCGSSGHQKTMHEQQHLVARAMNTAKLVHGDVSLFMLEMEERANVSLCDGTSFGSPSYR